MTHILTCWNIQQLSMRKIGDSVDAIAQTIAAAGSSQGRGLAHMGFILENKTQSGMIAVALRKAMGRQGLNYQFSYETSGDPGTTTGEKILFFWSGMQEPQLFPLHVKRAAGHYARDGNKAKEANMYRFPVAFVYRHNGSVYRVAAFHAPAPGDMNKQVWDAVYKRVLEIPEIDIVVGDFNIKNALLDQQWLDISSARLGGTTISRKTGGTTKNAYDKFLVNRGSGIQVSRVFKTEVEIGVSDHHCVSAVMGPLAGGGSALIGAA